MRVKLSSPARADLLDIGLYIADDSLERALAFTDQLESACLALGDQPRRYPAVLHPSGAEIRKRSFRDYVILYRINDTEIQVLRIFHGSLDLIRVLAEMAKDEP